MRNVMLLIVSIIFCYTGAQASDVAQNNEDHEMKCATSIVPAAKTFADLVDDVFVNQIVPKFYGRDLLALALTCHRFYGLTKDLPILTEYKEKRPEKRIISRRMMMYY